MPVSADATSDDIAVAAAPSEKAPVQRKQLELPDWLETCLVNPDSPATDEDADRQLVCKAFNFAYQLHEGQYRASGDPYIAHPVAVAGILRDLGGSSAMIAAGFLHDVVEDTAVTPDEIEAHFGPEVRLLVDGVTKLGKIEFSSKKERQAENFRRMFLAMAKDIRVIVVKLADRLHNMRTLEHLKSEKQHRISLETREIFAPLANRLGIGNIKWELEDLAFKYIETEAFNEIRQRVAGRRADREAHIEQSVQMIADRLAAVGITDVEISGRPKHLYGIYSKMQRQQKEYEQIFDVSALRVIVNRNDECYRALAVVHDLFRPIPGRFKDYIGLPKPNRYQSLHTGVIGLGGRPVEVQIRTVEMHHIAEYGIAAHWKYKESGGSSDVQMTPEEERFTWLRQLLEWQHDLNDAQEYLETVKGNLFEDDVFVFTPNGEVISLHANASTVDFAYRIHSEVGTHCCGAKVNGRIVTLDTRLHNGDIVEILTQKNAHPSLDWLNFVVTPSARNRIRQWYKRSHRDENIQRGRDMLEKSLGKSGFEALLKSAPMLSAAERCNYHSVEDFLSAIGYGEATLNHAINRIRDAVKAEQATEVEDPTTEEEIQLLSNAPRPTPANLDTNAPIAGVEGLLHQVAKCCNPLPGESIIGAVSRGGRGIIIHRQGCPNLDQVDGNRLIPVTWNSTDGVSRPHTYPVEMQIEVIDRVGILKDILSRLMDQNVNVRNAQVRTFPDQTAIIDLGIDVCDHCQLEKVFVQVRKLSDVLNLKRLSQLDET
ncbi:bifunctional (p)ppGpp synthetase/guanosine-3',5'-bis(diphosphate) 3'-pyrophosphohydrolase [filamentous cyanobacterium LEGE 11480]|uniref:Bifunctional (P)ppGpp synthetase/guanosine-3',5'-bis(Diphosphate) 3'-pyrophosphohydrolase n=2 Tax=Romeriopsis TaxID=2992131 RepID=A0A928VM64_9CYAN|nr:bifunctional (p)ppGpp synthetase/guanosine-3',5'-bis(diphosphate) 3'-pyrophosphohydrolase [Romeriopsis navalis LEGE 11480]